MNPIDSMPQSSVGQKMAYASTVLLPAKRFDEYLKIVETLLDETIHYIDPVHELHGKSAVLKMLAKYIPRAANKHFSFALVHEDDRLVIWKWKIGIRLRFIPMHFLIHGLVEAQVRDGVIIYQREYYDPMESLALVPIFGYLYKFILRLA